MLEANDEVIANEAEDLLNLKKITIKKQANNKQKTSKKQTKNNQV
jgi:hypothetical protein